MKFCPHESDGLMTEQYSRSRGPPFVRPNSRRVFEHSNTRSTTPSPPRICACEGASKQVDQRGRHAVPELQVSRHNAMPPTCVSQSSQTDERRRARRGERTETHAWADVGAFRHTRRQRAHTCRAALFRWWRQLSHLWYACTRQLKLAFRWASDTEGGSTAAMIVLRDCNLGPNPARSPKGRGEPAAHRLMRSGIS